MKIAKREIAKREISEKRIAEHVLSGKGLSESILRAIACHLIRHGEIQHSPPMPGFIMQIETEMVKK